MPSLLHRRQACGVDLSSLRQTLSPRLVKLLYLLTASVLLVYLLVLLQTGSLRIFSPDLDLASKRISAFRLFDMIRA